MDSSLILVAHNIRSAYNVGSFFRTADGAGLSKIILSGYSARPPHPGIKKTALGAEESVPWASITQPGPYLRRMRRAGYRIIALELTRGSKDIYTFRPTWPMVLVVGNELRGVSPAIRRMCHAVIHVPMRGEKESLNVASAMAVAVYSLTAP